MIPIEYAWTLLKFQPIPMSDRERQKLMAAHELPIPEWEGHYPDWWDEEQPRSPNETKLMPELFQSQRIGRNAPAGTHRTTDNITANPTPGHKIRDMADIPSAMQGMGTAEGRAFNEEKARTNPNPPEQRERVTAEQAVMPHYNPAAQVRELGLEGPKGATGPAMQQKLENIALRTSNDTVSVIMQILKGA